jgi:hypothetical protein
VTAARPPPDPWTGAVTDHIVVGDRVLLDAGFRAARARLGILARDGMLLRASEVAYGEAITALVKAAGPAAGLTRLAGARLDDLAETDDCAHIALQWQAIAADGKLFTVLDADLMVVPAGDQITALALAGAYRPQPGPVGAGLDQAIVRECATTAIRSFMARVACALVHPAGTAGPWRGATESSSIAGHQGQTAMYFTIDRPGRYLLATRNAAPGSITDVAVGRGIGRGILGPLVLIIAGSFALLAGLLIGVITAFRRRRARA